MCFCIALLKQPLNIILGIIFARRHPLTNLFAFFYKLGISFEQKVEQVVIQRQESVLLLIVCPDHDAGCLCRLE